MLSSETWDVLAEARLTVSQSAQESVEMCWRADGSGVAVNVHAEGSAHRKVLIFNSDLELQASGRFEDARPVTHLTPCIDWCPNHSLIASCTQRKSKAQIVFFEPNGLRHREFTVPNVEAATESVVFIRWNTVSTILAVVVTDATAKTSRLQLWMRSNYHWYLKHETRLQSIVSQLTWHPEKENSLYILLTTGEIAIQSFDWITIVAMGMVGSPICTAAVTDGDKLLLTHFHQAIVPPPMSSAALQFPLPIASVSFSPAADQVMVALSDGSIHFTDHNSTICQAPRLPWEGSGTSIRQLVWLDANSMTYLVAMKDKLLYVCGDASQYVHVNAPVLRFVQSPTARTVVYIHLENGEINRFCDFNGELYMETLQVLDQPCSSICVAEIDEHQVAFVTLNQSRLCVNATLIEKNVASMTISPSHGYLMFTTLGQTPELKFIALDNLSHVVATRKLERGSRIVAVTPEEPQVVLQMPRGNLEGIFPHQLVKAVIETKLHRQQYGDALEVCRKHRVDMQRLVTFGDSENTFANNCLHLITQIPPALRVNRLNLFITNLRDEPTQQGLSVNSICDLLRERIEQVDANGLLLCLLTCDVKKNPPEYGHALRRLQQSENRPVRPKALAYLTHLTSVDELFTHALGLYDFDLVYAVLQHLQKDPADYMAVIDSFKAYEGMYKNYKIDLYLKRYESALAHLYKVLRTTTESGNEALETECLALIRGHNLSQIAMSTFSRRTFPALHDKIVEAHGDYLRTQNGNAAEAAALYMTTKPPRIAKAVEAFREAGNWRMALVSAHDSLGPSELKQFGYALASDMTDQIGQESRPLVAAEILATICSDVDEAISVLVSAGLWAAAYQTAVTHGRKDLVETEVIPGVEYALESFVSEIQDRQQSYAKTKQRLDQVRLNREMFRLHMNQEPDVECDTESVYSVASSAMSAMSNFSVGSHNSSRSLTTFSLSNMQGHTVSHADATKSVRESMSHPNPSGGGANPNGKVKRQRMKKGGAEEEEYLVKCLSEVVPTVAYQKEVRALLTVGVYCQFRELAGELQRTFDAFMQQTETTSIDTIDWKFPSLTSPRA